MRIWGIDGGGTKTDAVICDEGGRVLRRTQGGPSNCSARPMEQVLSMLTKTIRALTAGLSGADAAPDAIFAGISGAGVGDNAARIRAHLQALFPQCPCIQAGTDAKNALRSAIPAGDGAIAIAGTGSGVFVFRGEEMQQIGGWGYLLGDEGSGGAIGRMLLRDCLRGTMPEAFGSGFRDMLGMDAAGVIDRIYTRPRPNAFCASLARYALDRKDTDPYAAALVGGALRSFFSSVVSLYDGLDGLAFNAVGTVARLCEKELMSLATEWGMKPGKVLGSPIEGLAAFHRPI